MKNMQVFGHRCCRADFPENTVQAATKSSDEVDGIEIDVRRSRDGYPIVFHDETVDRLTESSGPISDYTYQELQDLTIGESEETIPKFGDFVREVPDNLSIIVEMKSDNLGNLAEFESAVSNDLIWSSFSVSAIETMQRLNPNASFGYFFANDPIENIEVAIDLGCDYINANYELCLDSDLVEYAHAEDIAVNAWTVNSQEIVEVLESIGIDGVITDYQPESMPE